MISFTVITCTYNAQDVLQRTLDSVLIQTNPHVEHLIVDGASKDATMELVRGYQQKNQEAESLHEVTVVSEKDRGLYDAMNKAIRLARNEYLVFLNAGDVFPSEDTLDLIAGNVGEDEVHPAVLYGDTNVVDMDGHFLRRRRLTPPEKLTWKSFRWGMLVCHQSFYVRSDIAKQTPYNLDYRYSADVDWCIRVMRKAADEKLSLRNVHTVVTNYLDGGMSVQNHRDSLKERFQVMQSHYGFLTTAVMHVLFVFRAVLKK